MTDYKKVFIDTAPVDCDCNKADYTCVFRYLSGEMP